MREFLPYIVSIVTSLISLISSVLISRKQTKGEIDKLVKQHELDMEKERENHKYELEKIEREYSLQKELQQKEFESKLSSDIMNTIMTEAMKTPEIKQSIARGMRGAKRKK